MHLLLALLVGSAPLVDSEADAIVGLWLTEAGKARVEVRREGDEYRARIVWLADPNYRADDPKGMPGQPKVDRLNEDESLRSRPVIGLEIFWGFRYVGKNEWKKGRLYDPERGKSYKGILELSEDGTLKLRGYIGVPAIGKSSVWTPLPGPGPESGSGGRTPPSDNGRP